MTGRHVHAVERGDLLEFEDTGMTGEVVYRNGSFGVVPFTGDRGDSDPWWVVRSAASVPFVIQAESAVMAHMEWLAVHEEEREEGNIRIEGPFQTRPVPAAD